MIADSIINALRNALGERNIPMHEPRFAGNEQRYVQECIASTYVSSAGIYVDRFEKEMAPYRECPRAPLPVAESLERRIVNLPNSAGLA